MKNHIKIKDKVDLFCGDCLDVLPTLPAASVDCVLTDPPYPCIKRSYGTWTEAEWFAMMRVVVPECIRILKPTGSAVFILQPNSERVGRMRTWLWEFMTWVGKEWGIVQDAWWWNFVGPPGTGAASHGLMRTSIKACVWVGPANCHRNQDAVLWSESQRSTADRLAARASVDARRRSPSGYSVNPKRCFASSERRGGVTPFNLLPFPTNYTCAKETGHGHGASTPIRLADWWLRYICPDGGTVLDPFGGSGTVALAAIKQGKHAIGIERIEEYYQIAQRQIEQVKPQETFGL